MTEKIAGYKLVGIGKPVIMDEIQIGLRMLEAEGIDEYRWSEEDEAGDMQVHYLTRQGLEDKINSLIKLKLLISGKN